MNRFIHILIGDPTKFSFENRVFNLGILLGFFMTFTTIFMNMASGYPYDLDAFFALIWLGSYYLSRFRGNFVWISVIDIGILIVFFTPYMWLSSNGIMGSVAYYTIIFAAVIAIVLDGKKRLMMHLLLIFMIAFLTIYDAGSFAAVIELRQISRFFGLLIMTGSMAILITVYAMTYNQEKRRNEAYAATIESNYIQQIYYMENLEHVIDKLKSDRHDFNNHLGIIYELVKNSPKEEALDYLTQLIERSKQYRQVVHIPYPVIRAILNYKLSGIEEKKIDLSTNVSLPEGLKMNEFDVSVILGNLLDNAIEACEKVPSDQRYLKLDLYYNPDYLVIRVENSAAGQVDKVKERFKTTKPDSENHGFGLKNISYLVERHEGLMKIDSKQSAFIVNIALQVL